MRWKCKLKPRKGGNVYLGLLTAVRNGALLDIVFPEYGDAAGGKLKLTLLIGSTEGAVPGLHGIGIMIEATALEPKLRAGACCVEDINLETLECDLVQEDPH